MEAFLGCLGIVLVGVSPLLPLLTKQLLRARRSAVRDLGRLLTFATLWIALNVSFATMWGVLLIRVQPDDWKPFFFLWLLLFQVPAIGIVSRVMRDDASWRRPRRE